MKIRLYVEIKSVNLICLTEDKLYQ